MQMGKHTFGQQMFIAKGNVLFDRLTNYQRLVIPLNPCSLA
jgi:hypothetical protein